MGETRSIRVAFVALLATSCWLQLSATVHAARHDGKLTLTTIDEQTRERIAVRMELRDGRGRPVRVRSKAVVSHGDYFVFDGEVTLELRKGQYTFLIEAGPEYQTRPGHFTIERNAEDEKEVVLHRSVDMQAEGWWAGDLDVRQAYKDLPLLMRAVGVDLAFSHSRENIRGKCHKNPFSIPGKGSEQLELPVGVFLLDSQLDHRRGGGLLFLRPQQELDVCRRKRNDSSLPLLDDAAEADAGIVALKPFAWDLPLWIADGRLDAIQIIHRHALADGVVDNEGWGRTRDKVFFPGKQGNGRWSESIYEHVLNCGLRIPPAAGSGSGANANGVGTNRMYVHCGDQFSEDQWLDGLREGRVSVTNGPLLRTQVEGYAPGHVFHIEAGQTLDLQIGLSLTFYSKAPVEYLEIVKNGQVAYEVRLDEFAKKQGRLPPVQFDDSGWFAVRARTSNTKTYQYATTGPYYVESDYQRRISRRSVQFFLDWLDEAELEFAGNESVLEDVRAARPFWEALLSEANAE